MRLYLVHHGAAKTEAEDPLRGLTEEGQRAVERMADFLATLPLPLDCIKHSEKLRARQTAEILATRLRPAEGTRQIAGIGPNDDIEPMRTRLAKESKNLMLVGHSPYLSRLVARLLGLPADKQVVRFQMGGAVRLEREEDEEWLIRWVVTPNLLFQRLSKS